VQRERSIGARHEKGGVEGREGACQKTRGNGIKELTKNKKTGKMHTESN